MKLALIVKGFSPAGCVRRRPEDKKKPEDIRCGDGSGVYFLSHLLASKRRFQLVLLRVPNGRGFLPAGKKEACFRHIRGSSLPQRYPLLLRISSPARYIQQAVHVLPNAVCTVPLVLYETFSRSLCERAYLLSSLHKRKACQLFIFCNMLLLCSYV